MTIQSVSYAGFNTINTQVLSVGMVLCAICALLMYRMRHKLDILLLGRLPAINWHQLYASDAGRACDDCTACCGIDGDGGAGDFFWAVGLRLDQCHQPIDASWQAIATG